LGLLLAAAAAPAHAEELAGEDDAVARFARVYRHPARPRTRKRSARRRPLLTRAALVKTATAVAVLLTGGTALAGTGNLPAAAQQRVHDALPFLGLPGPSVDATGGDPTPSASGRSVSAPSVTPAPVTSDLTALCLLWKAHTEDPHSSDLSAADLGTLAAAAHGESAIPEFCRGQLAGTQDPSPSTNGNGSGKSTPTHPGGTPHPHPSQHK
jgi:hypothetical protein